MKYQIISIVFAFLFVSCGGKDTTNEVVAAAPESEVKEQTNELSKQKACEILPIEKVAQLMGVDQAAVNQEDMSFGDKRSICYYFTKEGNRKFFIRLGWESPKAIENGVLGKQYENYVASGENNIEPYVELRSSEQGQVIFGIGQDREGKYIHILRKRIGNSAEIQLEVTSENKDETIKVRLLEVADGIS